MTNQYTASHKQWDHVGSITPNVEYSEPSRPHGEYMVADWLPCGRYDKKLEEYFVVSAGKIVAFDRQGKVVPAGLKRLWADESGGGADVLTYDSTDYAQGVIDLATGVAVASASVGYTKTELSNALIARGLLDAGETADDFISYPVGVAPYNYFQWAGGDGFDPSQYRQHNHNLQHRVAILCKYVIEMPMVPASQSAINLAGSTAISDTAISDWTDADAQGAWFSSTALAATTRYASDVTAGDDVVALNLAVMNLAKDTTLTPFAFTGAAATAFANEVDGIANISQTGDYFVDYDVGVLLAYEADGDAAAAATGTFSYYHFDSAPTSVSTYACAVGDLKPGDFVRSDTNSNFAKHEALDFANSDTVIVAAGGGLGSASEAASFANAIVDRGLHSMHEVVGQVLDIEAHPKDYLAHVRTAYATLGTVDQMPGSASDGLPTQITYASGSNRVCRILLLK